MIVTLTPNPSIDRTVLVENLLPGEVNRAASSRIDPGGKGVNVAHALIRNGHPARAVLPLGGPDGELLARLLQNAGVPFDAVPIAGTTRTNIAIVDPAGVTTKVNEPGPELSPDEVERLGKTVGGATGPVVLCGSLPPGTDESFLAGMIALHRGNGCKRKEVRAVTRRIHTRYIRARHSVHLNMPRRGGFHPDGFHAHVLGIRDRTHRHERM